MEPDGGRSFATSLFFVSAAQNLLERQWLMGRGAAFSQAEFDAFVALALTRELAPLASLRTELGAPVTLARLKNLATNARASTRAFLSASAHCDLTAYRAFLRNAVAAMAEICAFEEGLGRQEDFLPPSAYRAFDAFDELLGLHFKTDTGLKQASDSKERLYLGGGAGVQTSYATIFSALEYLQLPTGAQLIDLGSGFGRVGLIAGLWRADLRSTGYEYVGSRVRVASDSAMRAGVADRIRFLEQDLADVHFKIPLADAYYMYDPFCSATYERVLEQLNSLSHRHVITVVTKADAGTWFSRRQSQGAWAAVESCDSGLLLVFRSRPTVSIPLAEPPRADSALTENSPDHLTNG